MRSDILINKLFPGIKQGFPVFAGYIAIAVAYGILAKAAGLSTFATVLMSVIVFAGASQFIAAQLFTAGAGGLEIVITTLVINFRHFLMSASLSGRIDTKKFSKLSVISFGITDETFAVASLNKAEKLPPEYFYGLNFTAYAGWVAGTVIGATAGELIPQSVMQSMSFALYGMFVALLVPAAKKSGVVLFVAVSAISVNILLELAPVTTDISAGWKILIATAAGAASGVIFKRWKNAE